MPITAESQDDSIDEKSLRGAELSRGGHKTLRGTDLSLVLPCFNEELNIERTIRDAQNWFAGCGIDGQIVVTDDGSTDQSQQILHRLSTEMPNLKVVRHESNQGYGAAVRSGCDHADKQWIAFMDSDGQFHAADIGRLLKLTDHANYVAGVREHRADSFQRWINARMFSTLVWLMLGVHPTDLNCGMKVFRASIWKTIRPVCATGALINAEIFYALKRSRIGWEEAPVPHYPRLAGTQTGASLHVILRAFKELWRLKWSQKPKAGARVQKKSPVPVTN